MNYIMSGSVCRYEDSRALWGGSDGLDVIRDIVNFSPQLIRQNGFVHFFQSARCFRASGAMQT